MCCSSVILMWDCASCNLVWSIIYLNMSVGDMIFYQHSWSRAIWIGWHVTILRCSTYVCSLKYLANIPVRHDWSSSCCCAPVCPFTKSAYELLSSELTAFFSTKCTALNKKNGVVWSKQKCSRAPCIRYLKFCDSSARKVQRNSSPLRKIWRVVHILLQ